MNYIETALSGHDLINQPMLNKGTAFTDEERDIFGLHGPLPPHNGTLEDQSKRRLRALEATPQDLLTWSNGAAVIGTAAPFPQSR